MIKHIFRITFGVILMIVGLAGLVLPLIPGLLLIFLGWALLIDRNPKALFNELMAKIKERRKKCLK